MPQRYFLPSLPREGTAILDGDLAHHLGRVLRVRPGDPLRLGDGVGGCATATVTSVSREIVEVAVSAVLREPRREPVVHLAFAPPRLQRAEWLFEHGTEVGVGVFHPLWTARTRPQGERVDRWRRLVRAAASQCDRGWLPEVRELAELGAFLHGELPEHRFVAAPGAPALGVVRPPAPAVVLLVGPEGGFDAAEERAVRDAGFVPAGLGPHTLRTETAALVGAALLSLG